MMTTKGTITDLFDNILRQIAYEANTPEEVIQIWVSIGKRLGVDDIFPAFKLIVLQDDDGSRNILGFIASPSDMVVEYLSSEDIFHGDICEEALRSISINKPVYH